MKKRLIIMLIFGLFLPVASLAAMPNIEKNIPNAKKVGTARMQVMFWDVYDITLLAPDGKWQKDGSFALKIDYLRRLKGPLIAKRSIEEMQKQGFDNNTKLNEWLEKMTAIFPNVEAGDTITGLRDANGSSHFYLGDRSIGQIDDPDFTEQFFGIWLNEKTSEPALRRQLLGQKPT